MATIEKEILGGFSRKIGTVLSNNWKGVDYMRSLPKAWSKPANQKQTDQRMKFAPAMTFLKPISKGCQAVTGARTPLNAAVYYHMKEVITGLPPEFSIDVSKQRYGFHNIGIQKTGNAGRG